MQRLNKVSHHIIERNPTSHSDDIVLVYAKRTPICTSKKGLLKKYAPEDLLVYLIKDCLHETGINPDIVDEVCIGNVLMPGSGALCVRQACLMAGLPSSSSASVVNRQCSSGLQSISSIANAISCGTINVGIAGGVEMMSIYNMMEDAPKTFSKAISQHKQAADCMLPMGITSENVSRLYGITREEQDNFALKSNQKALDAIKEGKFKNEIVAIEDVKEDQGPRQTSLQKLSSLRPSFDKIGNSTAGNSSQISDGASIVLLMKRRQAVHLNLKILARFVDFVTVGVPPDVMGIGPALAIPKLLHRNGLSIEDINHWELNEAFASQCLYCQKKLGIDSAKINPFGGAIALGHPLGCTGSRMTSTLLNGMNMNDHRLGIVSMCVGTGMGAAALFSRE